ncbi:MAG: MarR family winged helix-turn-helix transcriptional regulator [Rhizobiaceae bacterium]
MLLADGHSAGLKPAQWEALRYLARANRFSRTPGALASYLGSTKGTVSQTLMALERVGLVTKGANPGDGRSVRVDLTREALDRLAHDPAELLRQAVEALPATTRDGLDHGVRALIAKRLALSGGKPFGICRSCRYFAANQNGSSRHHCRLLDEILSEADAGLICHEQAPAA